MKSQYAKIRYCKLSLLPAKRIMYGPVWHLFNSRIYQYPTVLNLQELTIHDPSRRKNKYVGYSGTPSLFPSAVSISVPVSGIEQTCALSPDILLYDNFKPLEPFLGLWTDESLAGQNGQNSAGTTYVNKKARGTVSNGAAT